MSTLEGLKEALAYTQGDKTKARSIKIEITEIEEFSAKEIKEIRTSLNLSQTWFAVLMGVSNKTVEAWEAGTNIPAGSSRRLLGLLKMDKDIPKKYNIINIVEK